MKLDDKKFKMQIISLRIDCDKILRADATNPTSKGLGNMLCL